MRSIPRLLGPALIRAARQFPALLLTGPAGPARPPCCAASSPAPGGCCSWLSILETTGRSCWWRRSLRNFGKRLTKSRKLYLTDSGLACHLLGLDTERALSTSPFLGPLFEGFVATEIAKAQAGSGRRPELYHFRDPQGLAVDFVVPVGHRKLLLLEAKASRTVRPADAEPLLRLGTAIARYDVTRAVVHRPGKSLERMTALRPGVRAFGVESLAMLVNPT